MDGVQIWFKDLYEVRPDATEIAHVGSNAPAYCEYHHQDQGFTINMWDAEAARRLIEDNYSWFLPTYEGYPYPIQRVDAFKYFVLWHYGGVYLGRWSNAQERRFEAYADPLVGYSQTWTSHVGAPSSHCFAFQRGSFAHLLLE